jgi:starch phosphorylase
MSPAIKEQPSQDHLATTDDDRTGTTVETLKKAILENLQYVVGKVAESATEMDYFVAVAYTVRDRILARWLATRKNYSEHNVRVVCYLSAEFLMGPHLANNLLNHGEADYQTDQLRGRSHQSRS